MLISLGGLLCSERKLRKSWSGKKGGGGEDFRGEKVGEVVFRMNMNMKEFF